MMPHTDERFYKMSTTWTDDPKVATLLRFGAVDAILARDLFGQMIGYSRQHLTDGVVPGPVIPSLMAPLPEDHARRLAEHLADPGDWGALVELHRHEEGYILACRVLAYAKWNDTKAEVLARIEAGRAGARARWNGANGTPGRNAKRNAAGTADGTADA
jgi:hypothetical protein